MPETRGGALWRFLLAAVVVVLFTATATAVAGLLQFKQLGQDLSLTKPLAGAPITVANPGNPQTLLLIGSDHRAGTSWSKSNTDTMMLVRLDPSSSTINVLSIPRDLKVNLPQGNVVGPAKLNLAYSLGGPNLLVKTVQEQVLPGIDINHIIDVNFGGFKALVNAIGCVYAQVDHRYYHVSAPDAADNYSSIDIEPGYQKLCDADALAFVRFRHTDTDIVRNARQQDFLRWAKSQFSTSSLLAQRDRLISIFGRHAETDADLHSIDGLINLFNLVAFSAAHTVKQISFPAVIGPCNPPAPCYVLGDGRSDDRAYREFMTPTVAHPAPASQPAPAPASTHRSAPAPAPAPVPVSPDPADAHVQAGALSRAQMPVYVPGRVADGYHYCAAGVCDEGPVPDSYPRAYSLEDENGGRHPAYVITVEGDPTAGQYYDVQGTTWQDPPILSGGHETRTVDGKQLQLYYNGSKLTLVAWHGPHGAYWIANTLNDDLSGAQMLAIAASLAPA